MGLGYLYTPHLLLGTWWTYLLYELPDKPQLCLVLVQTERGPMRHKAFFWEMLEDTVVDLLAL